MEQIITKAKRLSNITVLLLLAAPFVVLSYMLYAFNPANADNTPLYVALLIADTIGIFSIMGLWFTILFDIVVPDHHSALKTAIKSKFLTKKRAVDVLITYAGEPIDKLEQTVRAARDMEYPHKTFILDDKKSDSAKALAKKLGVGYVTREINEFFKSGNVNNALKTVSKSEFFVILDCDMIPAKNFLTKTLPYMEDEKVAMVQTPQSYTNTDHFIASGASQSQDVFYGYVMPSKNLSNSAFCVGTNMVFRRSAIDQIGGIASLTHSEDIWTSLRLHEAGFRTIYLNEVLVKGEAPDTVRSYSKQQERWAKGGFSMLFTKNPLFIKNLSLDQKIQYFISNTHYLTGITILAYLLFPIIYLLFEAKPLKADNNSVWAFHYLPYVFFYYVLNFILMGGLKISTLSVAIGSYFPYLKAMISTLVGEKDVWNVTGQKGSRNEASMKWLWPHYMIIILTLFSLVIGWYNPIDFWPTLFYSLLASWNLYLLYLFVTGDRRSVNKLS